MKSELHDMVFEQTGPSYYSAWRRLVKPKTLNINQSNKRQRGYLI